MSKQKFNLTSDLVQVTKQQNLEESKTYSKEMNDRLVSPSKKKITLTIAVTNDFRAEIKSWCAKKNITVADALKKGFYLLKATSD